MKTIKGFVTISQYKDNNLNTTSSLGELTTQALTYSRDKGEYQNPDVPGYEFISFSCKDVDTGIQSTVDQDQVNQIINMVFETVDYCTSHLRPYDPENFRNTLISEFTGQASNINFGSFIENTSFGLPEWLEWRNSVTNDVIKIWLSDNSFREQYDEYTISVIPPIVNLNSLFGSYSAAVDTMQSRTIPELSELIQTARDVYPESYLRSFDFYYYNKDNITQKIKTTWTVLVYGKAGDNIDSIKDAIVEFILANSTHISDDWAVIYPEIMSRTEFLIVPRWDLIAIPNLTLSSGIYSSIVDPKECTTFVKDNIPFYPGSFIEDNINILPIDYKALMLLVVNGYTNMEGKQQLKEIFPDYIPISSINIDFNKMTPFTRAWVLILYELVQIAETATRFSTVPANYRRIIRNNIIFISRQYDNVNYLISVKSNNF